MKREVKALLPRERAFLFDFSRGAGLASPSASWHNFNMIRSDIRELLDRDPFTPFRLILSSGKQYDVLDPETTVLLKSEIFIALPDGERWSIVPLLHVTSIETLINGRGRRNGRTRRKRP